jgi:uncharacterized protein YmfQ (DUF2313 family)
MGSGMNAPDGSNNADDLVALGYLLADMAGGEDALLDENFPASAVDTLSEWEFRLGLPVSPTGATATRQAAVTAKRRATGGNIAQRVLSAVWAIDPTAALYTNSAVTVASLNPRGVFRFAIQLDAAVRADAAKVAAIRASVDAVKRAFTDYTLPTRVGFRCSDPLSLVDRDVLGH